MKILFVMRNAHYLRNYESVILGLRRRGHRIVVGFELDNRAVPTEVWRFAKKLARLNQKFIEIAILPERPSFWCGAASQLRALRDYCRYQLPPYLEAHRCAERAGSVLIWPLRRMQLIPKSLRAGVARVTGSLTAFAENVLPVSAGAKEAMRRHDPDIVLVTPLIDIGSDQLDYIKACRAKRIPVGHCVASWDNLTNKGLIKALPDRVFVWNEAQRREAVELHAIPAERVRVTGAQMFDQWFDYTPSRSREEFCHQLGLEPDRLIVLYTASSWFICRSEIEFVLRWLAALRASNDVRLREASVVIRPHPKAAKTMDQWDDDRLRELGPMVVFPRKGHMPISCSTRNDYFDSLHHSAVVVGINTSAMLEAGIVGRRCFTILLDEVREGQEGMLHFQHLVKSGFLGVATSLDEHVRQLSQEIESPSSSTRDFVRSFLRPFGLDQVSTPIFIAHVEDMEDLTVEGPQAAARLGWVLRPLLFPLMLLNAIFADGMRWPRRRNRARKAGRRAQKAGRVVWRQMCERRWALGKALRKHGLLFPLPVPLQPPSDQSEPTGESAPTPETGEISSAKRRHVA